MNKKIKSKRAKKIFFYSDPHFGHRNVIKYCGRPFESVDEMERVMVERYNNVVDLDDIVVWVGDCFFMSKGRSKDLLSSLNGSKILVLGNHDHSAGQMFGTGFDWVCEMMWMKIAGQHVSIKHYPFRPNRFKFAMRGSPDKELLRLGGWRDLFKRLLKPQRHIRFWFRRPLDHGGFHIHGHTHSTEKFNGKQIHVGVDAWDFAPVAIEELERHIHKMVSKEKKK